eukprot:6773670-Prymnesium_polylepis.1
MKKSGRRRSSQQVVDDLKLDAQSFPMYGMRMKDFMQLTRIPNYAQLKKDGRLKELKFDEGNMPFVNFVSHQWLGYEDGDPDGAHLKTLQDCFRRVMQGESIFRSEADAAAYFKGFTEVNQMPGGQDYGFNEIAQEAFRDSIAHGYVWMDCISIPQCLGQTDGQTLESVIEDQAHAVESIPAYIALATNFWVLAPSGCVHRGNG